MNNQQKQQLLPSSSSSSSSSLSSPSSSFNCFYCNQKRTRRGVFGIFDDEGIKYFCSFRCLDSEVKRCRKIKCEYCDKQFDNKYWQKNRKYCSKKCGRLALGDRYEKYNWCDLCNEWVLKEKSIFKPAGSTTSNRYVLKEDHYYCPKCKNNELRTSKKYNRNQDK